MTEKFQVQFLEEAARFLDRLEDKARVKIYYNIKKAQVTKSKKTDKTPIADLEKAERLRQLYFEQKRDEL